MSAMTSQITRVSIVYSTICSGDRSKKTSKLRVSVLCEGNPPVTGEFPAQRASNAENVSIWWRHHVKDIYRRYAGITNMNIITDADHFIQYSSNVTGHKQTTREQGNPPCIAYSI